MQAEPADGQVWEQLQSSLYEQYGELPMRPTGIVISHTIYGLVSQCAKMADSCLLQHARSSPLQASTPPWKRPC